MVTIRVDEDVFESLTSLAQPGETPGEALRRVLAGRVIEIDDETYADLVARSDHFGDTPSDVIRRVLGLGGNQPPEIHPSTVTFHIANGTGSAAWNSQAAPIHAHVGDTLRIVNDDSVPHRPHTNGAPFAHPATDIAPGGSSDYPLTAPFSGSLYDHDFGNMAQIWVDVTTA